MLTPCFVYEQIDLCTAHFHHKTWTKKTILLIYVWFKRERVDKIKYKKTTK